MLQHTDHKELLTLRAMAQALVEEADRMLVKREVRPVSTGRTKKTLSKTEKEKFLARRAKTRLRQL